ncbi:hypothetical protein [Streptomyces zingiberis]|uniref:Uncharacterized protein n=1 Tax=Streptomyces zingiberis TaxID=2053010 RepID=A0ABX1BZQ5_9ACTN|nr:hypothetical protein [Streptomyces zingiberis]NJQ03151.1 hypothetical protein [Streptomyces zingiberis]
MAEDRQNASVWLGAAASALAVLAFFGVTTYDELVAEIDPDSASREACTDAYEARQEYGDDLAVLGLVEAWRVYGRKMSAIAERTGDGRLTELFRVDGEASVETADAMQRLESSTSDAPARAKAAKDAWHSVCVKLLKDG